MTSPTLSIVIPTYNRAELLRFLLESIVSDFPTWPKDLQLVIMDNASTDGTAAVIEEFVDRGIPLESRRHSENLGMDANLAACFEVATGDYFWQLGDDELLYKGTAQYVLNFCRVNDFGLLHIDSAPLVAGQQVEQSQRLAPADKRCSALDSAQMIRSANVYLTFISANVINRAAILKLNAGFDPRWEMKTHVPQMAWICDVLKVHTVHYHCKAPLFGALHGNTGGYKLIEVFCVNFVSIVRKRLGQQFPAAGRITANSVLLRLLPAELMAKVESKAQSNEFVYEDVTGELDKVYGKSIYYRALVRPLLSGSLAKRRGFFFATRLFNRVDRMLGYRLL